MSNEKHETIEDILAEIRMLNPETFLVSKWCCEPLPNRMRSYADRIEAAYKRLAIPTPEQWTEIARQGAEIADLKRENARLSAALKIILECTLDSTMPHAAVLAVAQARQALGIKLSE